MAKGNLIGLMVREGLISFVHIDHSVFKKTTEEKLKVRTIAKNHKNAIKKLGFNPRKDFNPNGIEL